MTLFENIDDQGVIGLFLIVVAFVLSNVLIGLVPLKVVMAARRRHLIAAVDAVFICTFLYYLRVEQAPIHLPLMGIVVLAIIWPDLRVVLFAMFVVSLLFGLFTNLELFGAAIEIARDDFLTLSLLFIVAIFYIFMVERFDETLKREWRCFARNETPKTPARSRDRFPPPFRRKRSSPS